MPAHTPNLSLTISAASLHVLNQLAIVNDSGSDNTVFVWVSRYDLIPRGQQRTHGCSGISKSIAKMHRQGFAELHQHWVRLTRRGYYALLASGTLS